MEHPPVGGQVEQGGWRIGKEVKRSTSSFVDEEFVLHFIGRWPISHIKKRVIVAGNPLMYSLAIPTA